MKYCEYDSRFSAKNLKVLTKNRAVLFLHNKLAKPNRKHPLKPCLAEPLKELHSKGRLIFLPANIRLGRK